MSDLREESMLAICTKPGFNRLVVFCTALAIAFLAAAMVYDDDGNYFELRLWTPVPTDVQLFYDVGHGFGDDNRITHTSGRMIETLKFSLPAKKISGFRLDPLSGEGRVFLLSAQVISKHSQAGSLFPLELFVPVNHIARMDSYDGGVLIETVSGGGDPFLIAQLEKPLDLRSSFPGDYVRSLMVFPLAFVASYILLAVMLVKRKWLRASPPVQAGYTGFSASVLAVLAVSGSIRRRILPLLIRIKRMTFVNDWLTPFMMSLFVSLSVFLVIAGSRLWLVTHFGNELPLFDQWGAEGEALYKPYLAGNLHVASFWAPHNEHRIIFTRLLALSLFIINGQWDAHLQMVVNALIYACVGGAMTLLFARKLTLLPYLCVSVATALLLSLPVGYENTLWGFQSHFYLLIGFSLAAIWLLTEYRPMSMPWCAGSGMALCALFTLGSGVLVPFAVIVAVIVSMPGSGLTLKKNISRNAATLLICSALLLIYIYITPDSAGENRFKADSLAAFFKAFLRCTGWPNYRMEWWSLANWLPFLLFLCVYLKKNPYSRSATGLFTLTLGLWVLGQEAATSYARNSLVMVSKYLDLYAFALLTNIFAMLYCFSRFRGRPARIFLLGVFSVWMAGNTAGVYRVSSQAMGNLAGRYVNARKQVENVAAFLADGDIARIEQGLTNRYQIPMSIEGFETFLSDPVIRSILPESVQHALLPEERRPTGLLSIAARHIAVYAVSMLLAGIMLMPLIIIFTLLQRLPD